ncbi:hypothetical protein OG552_10500 [Streptomyces sp. NBC_01476]|uniref:hypothetical protein n=1 Tax=Streptomyces sp. NBC_01476 TaxID=2903881 RepID=UPI002E2F9049|nr:hypothetical protein [Streptomyces sp. NBC_01476]
MTTSNTKTATAPAQPDPPAAAVALDAHWAAKRERLQSRTNATAKLRICDDEDLKDDLAEAQRTHRQAEALVEALTEDPSSSDRLADAKKALAACGRAVQKAQAAVDGASTFLVFRALPRPEYEALIKAHPPTEEQAEEGEPWNIDTLAPALISAASVDGMPVEDATHYLDTWGPAESIALWQAAYSVQNKNRTDLGKG